jgi:hypothetical protein
MSLSLNVTLEFSKKPIFRRHNFNILNIYKLSITPFILLFLGVNNKNNISITVPILLFSYHPPYVILQVYCKIEYCKTVVSYTKHDDGLYITCFSYLLTNVQGEHKVFSWLKHVLQGNYVEYKHFFNHCWS